MVQSIQLLARSRAVALADSLRRFRFRSRRLRRPLVWVRQRGLERDDILLASYPRSGTTWLRFLLTEALAGEPAEFETVGRTVRYVGDHRDAPAILPYPGRVVFSHEPYEKVDHRVIYAVRDPRSVVISEYQWLRRRGLYREDFSAFFSDFIEGNTNPWGSWDGHVTYWLTSASAAAGRLLTIRFEDLRADTRACLRQIMRFLDVEASDELIEAVVRNNAVGEMRMKEERAPDRVFSKGVRRDIRFVNRGTTAGWKETLTNEQVSELETRFAEPMGRFGYISST